jgi:enamine deaminase RidA (YjgF/YER057c/UK114 family)
MTVDAHSEIPGLIEPSGPFSHATVGTGTRIVSLAGQVALDDRGQVVGADDAGAQARQCLANLDAALRHVGASPADVVKVTVFLTDVGDRAAVADARREYFGAHAPAATLVEVSALAVPGCVVEIEATAVLP